MQTNFWDFRSRDRELRVIQKIRELRIIQKIRKTRKKQKRAIFRLKICYW